VGVDGNVTPKEQRKTFCGTAVLEDAFGYAHTFCVAWEEEHGHSVVPLIGEELTIALSHLAEEAVWYLEENTRTVTCVALQSFATAVLEGNKDGKRVVHGLRGA
jgi:hypothetical protein